MYGKVGCRTTERGVLSKHVTLEIKSIKCFGCFENSQFK